LAGNRVATRGADSKSLAADLDGLHIHLYNADPAAILFKLSGTNQVKPNNTG
jgi:hypothetical protein